MWITLLHIWFFAGLFQFLREAVSLPVGFFQGWQYGYPLEYVDNSVPLHEAAF